MAAKNKEIARKFCKNYKNLLFLLLHFKICFFDIGIETFYVCVATEYLTLKLLFIQKQIKT